MPVTDRKANADIYEAANRVEGKIDRRLDTPAERSSAKQAITELRQAADADTAADVREAVQTIARLAPVTVLHAINPALEQAKWYVYDRTGTEIAIKRLN